MNDGPASAAVFEHNRPKAIKTSHGRRMPRDKATTFLREFLAQGEKRATEVILAGSAAGLSEKTIRRAALELRVEKSRRAGVSWWSLPGTPPPAPNTIPTE